MYHVLKSDQDSVSHFLFLAANTLHHLRLSLILLHKDTSSKQDLYCEKARNSGQTLSLCGEAIVRRYSVKKLFLEISQNSQENTRARVAGKRPATLLKKRLWHRCFLVNLVNFSFFIEHLCWLLLSVVYVTMDVEFLGENW